MGRHVGTEEGPETRGVELESDQIDLPLVDEPDLARETEEKPKEEGKEKPWDPPGKKGGAGSLEILAGGHGFIIIGPRKAFKYITGPSQKPGWSGRMSPP